MTMQHDDTPQDLDNDEHDTSSEHGSEADNALDRVLRRASNTRTATVIRDLSGAQALGDEAHEFAAGEFDAIRLGREERASLRRVAGLSTELEDVTEVE